MLKLLSPVVLVVRQFYAHTAPILKADYDIGRYPASIYCPGKIGDINIQILARSKFVLGPALDSRGRPEQFAFCQGQ
ncbi:hypothetical protein quinque_009952 [Culex quinquefasciatus]